MIFKLELADAALKRSWIFTLKMKFEARKIGVRNDSMCLEAAPFFLLLEEKEEVVDLLIKFMVFAQLVVLMQTCSVYSSI